VRQYVFVLSVWSVVQDSLCETVCVCAVCMISSTGHFVWDSMCLCWLYDQQYWTVCVRQYVFVLSVWSAVLDTLCETVCVCADCMISSTGQFVWDSMCLCCLYVLQYWTLCVRQYVFVLSVWSAVLDSLCDTWHSMCLCCLYDQQYWTLCVRQYVFVLSVWSSFTQTVHVYKSKNFCEVIVGKNEAHTVSVCVCVRVCVCFCGQCHPLMHDFRLCSELVGNSIVVGNYTLRSGGLLWTNTRQ